MSKKKVWGRISYLHSLGNIQLAEGLKLERLDKLKRERLGSLLDSVAIEVAHMRFCLRHGTRLDTSQGDRNQDRVAVDSDGT